MFFKPKKDVWPKIERRKTRPKYLDKFQLLNKPELELLHRLKIAMPALHVFAQVSMSQIFFMGKYRKDSFLQISEIGMKSVDFLVCRDDTSIVLAIELNASSYDEEKQKEGDERKMAAFEEAGIPLLIFTPETLPDVSELRKAIAPHMVERRKTEKKQ